MPSFVILECSGEKCGLRFPHAEGERALRGCPACGAPLAAVARGQSGGENGGRDDGSQEAPAGSRVPLALLLDNLRSAFNVGSILRSADGAGAAHVYLCGITPTPTHPRVARTALGAEKAVAWSAHRNSVRLAQRLIEEGALLWALEEAPDATPLQRAVLPTPERAPGGLVLIAGNEVTGVDPGLRALCAATVCLPMRGRKRSLNVAVATGIALHWLALATESSR